MGTTPPLVVTGASGRLGRMLQRRWAGQQVVWLARHPAPGCIAWNIGVTPPPALPDGAVILHLAGVTRGDAEAQSENPRTARALAFAARGAGARHVLFASTAAVYPPGDADLTEETPPAPPVPYGQAKLDSEEVLADELEGGPGLTILRIGNVVGSEALLGLARPGQQITLVAAPGQARGPLRTYIGPCVLAEVLWKLAMTGGEGLPAVLNIAQPGAVAMADLLDASGLDWRFGSPSPEVIDRVVLAVNRLAGLVALPAATPAGLIADWHESVAEGRR